MMRTNKFVKIEKSTWGLSGAIVFFDKVSFYAGWADHWGLGFDINFYDRALTFNVLNAYFGVEVWHKE